MASITSFVGYPLYEGIKNSLEKSESAATREIGVRAAYAGTLFVCLGTNVTDVAVGTIAAVGSLLTLGYSRKLNGYAYNCLGGGSKGLIANPYFFFLRFINPAAKMDDPPFECTIKFFEGMKNFSYVPKSAFGEGFYEIGCESALVESRPTDMRELGEYTHNDAGLFTKFVKIPLMHHAKKFSESENCFVKYVVSRLTYALMGICCIITRLVDLIFGLIAGLASILTLGKIDFINRVAYEGLMAPALIFDLYFCLLKTINPFAKDFAFDNPHAPNVCC